MKRIGSCWLLALCTLSIPTWAQGSNVVITLQPVAPQTDPPSQYPAGTTIVGQEIILGSVPARVWLEIYVTGWAPFDLEVVQADISATDSYHIGGGAGYLGSNAICLGIASVGAGDLGPAMQPCSSNADCRALSGPRCSIVESSKCITYNSNWAYFPPGKFCEPGFQNQCRPDWIGHEKRTIAAVDISTLNFRFGVAVEYPHILHDFGPSYLGTLVLDVPANAKGTYTIGFRYIPTFLQNFGPPGANLIPIHELIPARITIPCGRCCSGYEAGVVECVDHVAQRLCDDALNQVFASGEGCPENGGPDCPACPSDEFCDDGIFCNGAETCDPALGCVSGGPPCAAILCEEDTDWCRPVIPTVNAWGLSILGLLLLILGKLRFGRAPSEA